MDKQSNRYYVWEEKNVVEDYKNYRIVVDRPGHANLVTVWTADEKKVATLIAKPLFPQYGFLNVDYAYVEPLHRGQNLLKKMYKALLSNLSPNWLGISYYTPDKSSKKQIPSVWRELGAKPLPDNEDLIVILKKDIKRVQAKSQDTKKEPTDFPSKGEDQVISFRNSEYPQADYAYCKRIKENYPELWSKGGNDYGNTAFEYWTKYRKGDRSIGVLKWLKKREAWFARHWRNKNVPGIIAWLKWGGYGHLGESKVKQILREEMQKIDAKKKKSSQIKQAALFNLKGALANKGIELRSPIFHATDISTARKILQTKGFHARAGGPGNDAYLDNAVCFTRDWDYALKGIFGGSQVIFILDKTELRAAGFKVYPFDYNTVRHFRDERRFNDYRSKAKSYNFEAEERVSKTPPYIKDLLASSSVDFEHLKQRLLNQPETVIPKRYIKAVVVLNKITRLSQSTDSTYNLDRPNIRLYKGVLDFTEDCLAQGIPVVYYSKSSKGLDVKYSDEVLEKDYVKLIDAEILADNFSFSFDKIGEKYNFNIDLLNPFPIGLVNKLRPEDFKNSYYFGQISEDILGSLTVSPNPQQDNSLRITTSMFPEDLIEVVNFPRRSVGLRVFKILKEEGLIKPGELKSASSISYTGIVLDSPSVSKLLAATRKYLEGSEDFKEHAHHLTLTMGPLKEGWEHLKGKKAKISVDKIGVSEKAICVKSDNISVDGEDFDWYALPRKGKGTFPHITVYTLGSAKPYESNNISHFLDLDTPLTLTGVVEEVPNA